MKFQKLKIGTAIAFVFFVFICGWVIATPCPKNTNTLNAPQYIESAWPPSDSETSLGCYIKFYITPPSGKGVGVQVNTGTIWKLELPQTNRDVQSSFPNRVSLFVDGEQVSIDVVASGGGTYFTTIDGKETELDLAGWYFFGSNHFVLPGDHQAKVVIITKSGKTLEYEWGFRTKIW